jgi:hypothetical protein
MNITVTHTLAPEIIELLKNFGNPTEKIASPEIVKEATPVKEIKAKKVAKTETEESKDTETEKQAETKSAGTEKPAEQVTFENIRLAVQQKAQGGKRDEVKKLLTEFGVEKVSALEKDQYADFYTKVNKL